MQVADDVATQYLPLMLFLLMTLFAKTPITVAYYDMNWLTFLLPPSISVPLLSSISVPSAAASIRVIFV